MELPLKSILKIGKLVVLWEKSPDEVWDLNQSEVRKRVFKITSFESDGRIQMRFHQQAKPDKELVKASEMNFLESNEKLRISVSKFNALVEGVDFKLSPLGKITKI